MNTEFQNGKNPQKKARIVTRVEVDGVEVYGLAGLYNYSKDQN